MCSQLLEAPKLLSLFQFLNYPEIPPQTIVNEVGSLEKRNAEKFVFSKFTKIKDRDFPSITPISLNKGHSTLIKASISKKESFDASCKPVKFQK